MSALTGVSAAGAVGSVGPVHRIALTGVSASTSVGAVGAAVTYSGLSTSFNLRVPTPQLAMTGTSGASGTLALSLPTPTIALTGTTDVTASLKIAPRAPALVMSGITGAVGALSLAIRVQLRLFEGNALTLRQPRPQLAMAGTTGVTGALRLPFKAPAFAAVGNVPIIGSLSLALPAPQIALSGSAGASARLGIQLRALTLAMRGTTGTLGTLTLAVPMVRFTAAGFWEATGVLQLTLPSVQLALTGGAPQTRSGGGSAPLANPNTLVMHTERQALSQYTNYPFNSFARFAGTYIGASDAGVFALTGNTDNGAIIEAAARGGITDFGTSHIKRVDRIYVGYRADGDLILRVITDEGSTRDYLVPKPQPQFNNQLHGNHVRMGRGVEARYWQFELRNRNGANFSLDIIEMKPTKLRRRIGGSDA